MRRKNRVKSEENSLDLTPMMDIVFIMLIFFIVTATFVKEMGLDVNTPDKNQNVKDADKQSIVENDYKMKLLEILKTQDKKNAFKNIRQLMADSKVTDFADLFRLMYDEVDTYGRGHVAECI